jgi:hypothetical protein
MEAVKETPKTLAPVRFSSTIVHTPGSENPNPRTRQQEVVAWLVIAAIWATFAFSLYLIWTKASDGI